MVLAEQDLVFVFLLILYTIQYNTVIHKLCVKCFISV